jgi:hypothetical protein
MYRIFGDFQDDAGISRAVIPAILLQAIKAAISVGDGGFFVPKC